MSEHIDQAAEEDRELPMDPTGNGHDEAAPDNSILESLREARREVGEDRDTYLDIPGYEDAIAPLVGHYRKMEFDEVEKIGLKNRRSKNPRRGLNAQIDVIASALIEMCVRLKDGTIKPLAEIIPAGNPDVPVRYDNRLGEFLGFDPEGSARVAVLSTFNNELAVPVHHLELMSWMQLSRADEEADFIRSS